MPDFERITSKLEAEITTENEKLAVLAYRAGMNRARKEVAVIFAVAMLTFVALRLWG